MPQIFEFDSIDKVQTYLSDVFDSIIIKDIVSRYKITNINLFKRIVEYLVTNPSQRILSRKDKYYLTDLGIGQILNKNKREQFGSYLENIVYNEWLYRGYDVSIGNNDGREIDFIATKYKEKIYIQVAYLLADESVIEREFGAYKGIDDNYPKYVITLDKYDFSENGIIYRNIIDWLLEK